MFLEFDCKGGSILCKTSQFPPTPKWGVDTHPFRQNTPVLKNQNYELVIKLYRFVNYLKIFTLKHLELNCVS